MILLLDLGNTNLYIGVHNDKTLISEYRTYSDLEKTSDMWCELINTYLANAKISIEDINGAILSSVIPSLTLVIKSAIERLIKKPCLVLSKQIKSGLAIRIDNPSELGTDLIADSIGAIKKYGAPLIICDLGTANKLLVIDKNEAFVGCTISPGLKQGQKALSSGCAQLMDTSLIAPQKVIGKNSLDSINSGAIYGTKCMIEGMSKLIEDELGYKTTHILTGGNAELIKDCLDNYIYDPHIVLDGLYHIYKRNS